MVCSTTCWDQPEDQCMLNAVINSYSDAQCFFMEKAHFVFDVVLRYNSPISKKLLSKGSHANTHRSRIPIFNIRTLKEWPLAPSDLL